MRRMPKDTLAEFRKTLHSSVAAQMGEEEWNKNPFDAECPDKCASSSARRNVVWESRSRGRRILNEEDAISAVKRELECACVKKVSMQDFSLDQQVHLLAHTDIFMGAHGAGGILAATTLPAGSQYVEM